MRSIFPETTIVRPAPMFGYEDNLLTRLAGVTNILTSNHMREKYWPVHVINVGQALEVIAYDDSTASQTYELHGPEQYSAAKIAELVDTEILKRRRHINVPRPILRPIAKLLNRVLWWPVINADDVDREFIDQVIDPKAKKLEDLGIEADDIKDWTYNYVVSIGWEQSGRSGNNLENLNRANDLCSKDTAAHSPMTWPRGQKRR